jgi:hypothetical protein
MALKSGDKIVAHTRLAVDVDGAITLFTPGEVITIGKPVTADQAQNWLACGSAGLFEKPAPAAADPAA